MATDGCAESAFISAVTSCVPYLDKELELVPLGKLGIFFGRELEGSLPKEEKMKRRCLIITRGIIDYVP